MKTLAEYSAHFNEATDRSFDFVVPITPPKGKAWALGAMTGGFAAIAGGALGGALAVAAIPIVNAIARRRGRIAPTTVRALGFAGDEIVEMDNPAWPKRRRGDVLHRYPIADTTLRYTKTDIAVITRLFINDAEWEVAGWFERDLLAALDASPWSARLDRQVRSA